MWCRPAALALAPWLAAGSAVGAAGDPIVIESAPVRSAPGAAEGTPVGVAPGAPVWRGGLHLRSADPRFGGLSGLAVSGGGRAFVAITDAGHWIAGALAWEDGRLAGVEDARIFPLRDSAGTALSGKDRGDAEALARTPGGAWLVAFEGRHRLLRYAAPGGRGVRAHTALDLAGLPRNGGIEAMTFLADGTLLALAEGRPGDEARPAWRVDGARAAPFAWPAHPFFRPTAATALPDGTVLVLERGYSRAAGVKARLMRMDTPGDAPCEIARFEPPAPVDNFEALAAFETAGGGTALLIASDDNFSTRQRTLLMLFALAPWPP